MLSSAIREQLRGSVVVLACPCTGNLGAMTMDCLLATLSARGELLRTGIGISDYLLPMTGYEKFPGGSESSFLTMPLEVYSVKGMNHVCLIQIRSDCDPKQYNNLLTEITELLTALSPQYVLGISGFGEDDVLDEHQSFRYQSSLHNTVYMPFSRILMHIYIYG